MLQALLALGFVLLTLAQVMGVQSFPKKRVLQNATSTSGTVLPNGFPTSGTIVHAGDMAGTIIGIVEVVSTNMSGTSITPTFETSHDGVTWTLWFTGSAVTTNATAKYYAETDFKSPARFVRTTWANAGAGTGTAVVNLYFAQVGPRGCYAPPGTPDGN